MTRLTGTDRALYVQSMFARIAERYDLMNRLMTAGQDVGWRRLTLDLAQLPVGGRLLDLGTGTGELALEALRRDSALRAVGGDFTVEMMRMGQARSNGRRVQWAGTDALNLPFPDNTFDAVTSGYLMRNVVDVRQAWREQYRVLKPEGRVVCLDTTPPARNPKGTFSLLHPFINFHLHVVIPTLGRLVAGESEAYTYLPDSTENFLPAEQLAARLTEAGFKAVQFRRLMLGTMAIHWANK